MLDYLSTFMVSLDDPEHANHWFKVATQLGKPGEASAFLCCVCTTEPDVSKPDGMTETWNPGNETAFVCTNQFHLGGDSDFRSGQAPARGTASNKAPCRRESSSVHIPVFQPFANTLQSEASNVLV